MVSDSDSASYRHPFASELIARARQIGGKLRAQQDQSDARGCYSDEIHRELLEGGFYRILQPRMFNGGGVDCETYIRVIFELPGVIRGAAGVTPSPHPMP
jgi:hypothetical protein